MGFMNCFKSVCSAPRESAERGLIHRGLTTRAARRCWSIRLARFGTSSKRWGYPGKAPSLQIEPDPACWSVERNEWNPCLSTVLASLEENPGGRLVTRCRNLRGGADPRLPCERCSQGGKS